MSLKRYLMLVIWLCILPLIALSMYLAFQRLRDARSAGDAEALNLAQNLASAVDHQLNGRIRALGILAASPLADDAARRADLYREAQGYHAIFDSHVILADPEMRMLFNTRVAFGDPLPSLPVPRGRAAAPEALETGKPAVGDLFFGPIAGQSLVAIAVPGKREGRAAFLLLATLEAAKFQARLDEIALPANASLALVDGNGEVIAQRAPPGFVPAADPDAADRIVVRSTLAPWSVVLEVPSDVRRAPQIAAGAELALLILGATVVALAGGMIAGRRLGDAVASLAEPPPRGEKPQAITEITEAQAALDLAAQERDLAKAALGEAHRRLQALSARLIEVHDAERAVLADELLGEIGQALMALKLQVLGLARRLSSTPDDDVTRLSHLIDDALGRLRRLALDLRPPQLPHLGLAATLRDALRRVASANGIEVHLVAEPEQFTLEPVLANTAFRVAQEAIVNAVRHAAASRITVELRLAGDALELVVADDGRGFDVGAARRSTVNAAGVGLFGMEERVALVRGELHIESRQGHGTRVQVRLPLRPPAPA